MHKLKPLAKAFAHDLLSKHEGGTNSHSPIFMKTYLAHIRINGQIIQTHIYADSAIHARLLAQYAYGMSSIGNDPIQVKEGEMLKTLPPDKARVAALQLQKDNAVKLLKAERTKQKIKQAQQEIFKATH